MLLTDLINLKQSPKLSIKLPHGKSECLKYAEKVILKYGSSVPKSPENIKEVLSNAREAFNQNREDTISSKSLRDLAYLSLTIKDDDLFISNLFRLLKASPSKRCLSALFASYVMHFDKTNKMCIDASQLLLENINILSNSWKKRLEVLDLLNYEVIEERIAEQIIKSKSESRFLNEVQLVGAFAASGLVISSYLTLSKLVKKEAEANNFEPLNIFIDIVARNNKIELSFQLPAMIGLLSPFFTKSPPPHLKDKLQTLFTSTFSDPRISSSDWPQVPSQHGGDSLRDGCLSLIKRWLIFETIEMFFKVIAEHAPNEQFEPRRRLWKSYFDNNNVTDAYIILGRDAAKTAQHFKESNDAAKHLKWGIFSGGVASDQSVLLMHIGSLVVAEWSHNGKFRAWDINMDHRPVFYKDTYSPDELRRGSNRIKKKDGSLSEGIVHIGDWVDRAQRYINQQTDIKIPRKIR